MTGGELRDEALRRVDEDPANPRYYTAAEALAAVGEAEQLFTLLTLCLEAEATVALTPAATFFLGSAVSDRWICPLRIRSGAAKLAAYTLEELAARNRAWIGETAPVPLRYAASGPDFVFIHPAPVGAVNLSVTYGRMPVALTAGNAPEIPESYHWTLLDYAVPRLRGKEGGQALEGEMTRLGEFLTAAGRMADSVRARNRSRGYDIAPRELSAADVTRVLERIRRGAQPESGKRG